MQLISTHLKIKQELMYLMDIKIDHVLKLICNLQILCIASAIANSLGKCVYDS